MTKVFEVALYVRMFATVVLSAVLAFNLPVHGGETKEVCTVEKDKKGKDVKVCKKVKVHAKLDGTKVPPK